MCDQNCMWGVEDTYKTGEIRDQCRETVVGLSRGILHRLSSKDIFTLRSVKSGYFQKKLWHQVVTFQIAALFHSQSLPRVCQ